MWFEYEGNNIIIHLEDEREVNPAEIFEQMSWTIDITFGDILNEGWPIFSGNDFAAYHFTAYVDGYIWTYRLSAIELNKLKNDRVVSIEPFAWNELEDVRKTLA